MPCWAKSMIGEEREHDRTCASDPQDERVVLIRMSRFEELLPFGSGRTGFAVCSLFVIILVGRAKGRSASRCNEELTAASRVVFFKSRTRFDRHHLRGSFKRLCRSVSPYGIRTHAESNHVQSAVSRSSMRANGDGYIYDALQGFIGFS